MQGLHYKYRSCVYQLFYSSDPVTSECMAVIRKVMLITHISALSQFSRTLFSFSFGLTHIYSVGHFLHPELAVKECSCHIKLLCSLTYLATLSGAPLLFVYTIVPVQQRAQQGDERLNVHSCQELLHRSCKPSPFTFAHMHTYSRKAVLESPATLCWRHSSNTCTYLSTV